MSKDTASWGSLERRKYRSSSEANGHSPGDVDSVINHKVEKGVDQYLIRWRRKKGSSWESWETEEYMKMVSPDALVKFWTITTLSDGPGETKDNENKRLIFKEKLLHWARGGEPLSGSNNGKSQIQNGGFESSSAVGEKAQCDSDEDSHLTRGRKKRLLASVAESSTGPGPSKIGLRRNSETQTEPSFVFPSNIHGVQSPSLLQDAYLFVIKPEDISELLHNTGSELGQIIRPSVSSESDRPSYVVGWTKFSTETPKSLGIDNQLIENRLDKELVVKFFRMCYNYTTIHVGPVESENEANTDASSCHSDISEGSAHPGSSKASVRSLSSMEKSSEDGDEKVATTSNGSICSGDNNRRIYSLRKRRWSAGRYAAMVDCKDNTDKRVKQDYLSETGDDFVVSLPDVADSPVIDGTLSAILLVAEASDNATTIEVDDNAVGEPGQSLNVIQNGNAEQDLLPNHAIQVPNSIENAELEGIDIEYEVDLILDHRMIENIDEYFIKWKNYTEDFNTWEPESNLEGCNKVIGRFYASRVAKRRELLKEYKNQVKANRRGRRRSIISPPILPSLPPIPSFVMDKLYADGEGITLEMLEHAFQMLKITKSRLTIKKLRRYFINIAGALKGSSDWQLEAEEEALLKQEILFLYTERKKEHTMMELKNWENSLNIIADGKPKITVVNDQDLAGPPTDFMYINDYVAGEGVVFTPDPTDGCECEPGLCHKSGSCCSSKKNPFGRVRRTSYKLVKGWKKLQKKPGYPIYECNDKCKCGPECVNRVVQEGTSALEGFEFCIFRTDNGRGWGVKTLKKIKKGAFVGIYAGEVITSEEAEKRTNDYNISNKTYLFDLDYYYIGLGKSPYTVDATKMGNVSHFINHSCDPNMHAYNVWVNCRDKGLPKLAFFTLRQIAAGEELTYDYYHENIPSVDDKDDEDGEEDEDDEENCEDTAKDWTDIGAVSESQSALPQPGPSLTKSNSKNTDQLCLCGAAKCKSYKF